MSILDTLSSIAGKINPAAGKLYNAASVANTSNKFGLNYGNFGPISVSGRTVLGMDQARNNVRTTNNAIQRAINPPTSSVVSGVYEDGGGGDAAGGGGYAGGSAGGYTDPYAAWGGTARYNQLVNDFNTQKSNVFGTARDAAANAGIGLNSSILNFVDTLKAGQNKVNNQAVQNELAKRQGTQGVLGMVGRGIQSGGVMLANKNASNSSAAGALARAYGDIGRRELSGVGTQYAQGQNAVQQAQVDVDTQRAAGVRNIGDSKTQAINQIVADARNQLAALDTAMAGASLPNRINIEAEKENVRNQAIQQLQQYDQLLNERVAGVQASSPEARRAEAARLATEGVAPESAFNFTNQIPGQFQNTGPFSSSLPIFTFPGRRNES